MAASGLLAAVPAASTPEFFRALNIQAPLETVEAPDFSLPDSAGKFIRLREFRGRHVFLNFFATWCGPCRDEMPAMEQLHRIYGARGLTVLAVDLQESPGTVAKFFQELRLTFPALIDSDGKVSREFAVRGLPVTYLVDPGGRMLWRAFGAREWSSQVSRRYFAALLEGKPKR